MAVKGVSNSAGASASAGMGGLVLVTSHGFSGSYMGSRFSRSVGVIAGEGTKMERDHDFDSRIYFAELDSPEEIGRRAGERTVARINPRQVPTAKNLTVVFDPAWHAVSSATLPVRSMAPRWRARPPSCATAWASRC